MGSLFPAPKSERNFMQIRKELLAEIQHIIAASREVAIRSVDHQRVLMYWHIGKKIFEEEQGAKDRADCGSYLLKYLAEKLEPSHGSGFSRRQLELCRQFYRTFPIVNTLYSQLSWSQYKPVFENPTISILLCADKNDAVVRFSLPKQDKQIVASKYQLYLPSAKQLMEEMKKRSKTSNR
jgi:hypothetical protein